MRRLITVVAAVVAAVVALSVVSGRMQTGLGRNAEAAAPKHSTAKHATKHVAYPSSKFSTSTGSTTGTPGDATHADVATTGRGSAIVYRLTAATAVAGGGSLVLYGPAASLTSTTGTATRSTSGFISSWASDPLASSLTGVVLTSDGVRHTVTLSSPVVQDKRLSFSMASAASVSAVLATDTGLVDSGSVAGVSGTLSKPVLFVALASGRTLRGCQLVPGADCDGKDLQQAVLSSADLARASLRGANLWQAVLHRASLKGADLTGARAFRTDLSAVDAEHLIAPRLDLTQGSATGADFTGALLEHAKVNRADLTRADFTRAYLEGLAAANVFAKGADFSHAELAGAQFPKADLTNADFRGADLRGANLDRADLTGADFTGADLTGAVLNRATVKHAVFTRATFDHTTCVDGAVGSSCS